MQTRSTRGRSFRMVRAIVLYRVSGARRSRRGTPAVGHTPTEARAQTHPWSPSDLPSPMVSLGGLAHHGRDPLDALEKQESGRAPDPTGHPEVRTARGGH